MFENSVSKNKHSTNYNLIPKQEVNFRKLSTNILTCLVFFRLSVLRKKYYVFMCDCVFFDWCSSQCLLLTVGLQSVNSENEESDDDPLALALRSLHFLSASQTLFASYSAVSDLMRTRRIFSILCSRLQYQDSI